MKFIKTLRQLFAVGENVREILRIQRFNLDRDRLLAHGIAVPAEANAWWTGRWELVEVKLGELLSYENFAPDRVPIPLADTPLYRYLSEGDESHLRHYIELHNRVGGCMTRASYDTHRKSLSELDATLAREPYSPAKCVIVVDRMNAILDGTHRASCLLARRGKEPKITVLRILPNSHSNP